MKRRDSLAVLLGLSLTGCQTLGLDQVDWTPWDGAEKTKSRSQNPDDDDDASDDFTTKVKTKMLGEYTTVQGLHPIVLEGVGLVVGLAGTGGDPPPSMFRTALLDDMRKRGVSNPNTILQSPNTALVAVRAYVPPLVRKGDRFDVEVRLPDNGDATSLEGGYLLETHLSEQAIVPGRGLLKGHAFAIAKGPVMVSHTPEENESRAGLLRRGRVLGGAASLKERDMALYLRNDFRSARNAKRVAVRIGERFHMLDERGLRVDVAEAKTDQKVELKIVERYRDNFPRFLQVVRNISFVETPVAQRLRIEDLKDRLNSPETSLRASLELEAIGDRGIPILKSGLKHPSPEVRFHAATALAYLDDPSGLKALSEAARDEPAFRIFAFAALAAIEDADAQLALRDLLDEPGAETRYGAFRALTTIDPHDPFLRPERFRDEFSLYVPRSKGTPLVHVTHKGKAEIVVFGADQRLQLPVALRAGRRILVTGAAGADEVQVAAFVPGEADKRRTVSSKLVDVLRTAAEFGAAYPDLVHLLMQADRQENLAGRLEIDALPRAGRSYARPASVDIAAGGKRTTRIGQPGLSPNLFTEGNAEPPEDGKRKSDDDSESDADGSSADRSSDRKDDDDADRAAEGKSRTKSGEASIADLRNDSGEEDDDRKWYDVTRLFRRRPDAGAAPKSALSSPE